MLGSNDPHRFRKTVAGACMVVPPALGLVGSSSRPATTPTRAPSSPPLRPIA